MNPSKDVIVKIVIADSPDHFAEHIFFYVKPIYEHVLAAEYRS